VSIYDARLRAAFVETILTPQEWSNTDSHLFLERFITPMLEQAYRLVKGAEHSARISVRLTVVPYAQADIDELQRSAEDET
jgi:hypothetical protein